MNEELRYKDTVKEAIAIALVDLMGTRPSRILCYGQALDDPVSTAILEGERIFSCSVSTICCSSLQKPHRTVMRMYGIR